jgi:heme-degrading monooxygenase HmoA
MIHVSLTRLRVRAIRFMPGFAVYAIRANGQVKRAAGFLHGALLPDRHRAFWTMTAWDSAESMRAYMLSGAHRQAMPKLLEWCDEASVAHWEQAESELPAWEEADRRMRASGRISKVRYPSPQHAAMDYVPPRTVAGTAIRRA